MTAISANAPSAPASAASDPNLSKVAARIVDDAESIGRDVIIALREAKARGAPATHEDLRIAKGAARTLRIVLEARAGLFRSFSAEDVRQLYCADALLLDASKKVASADGGVDAHAAIYGVHELLGALLVRAMTAQAEREISELPADLHRFVDEHLAPLLPKDDLLRFAVYGQGVCLSSFSVWSGQHEAGHYSPSIAENVRFLRDHALAGNTLHLRNGDDVFWKDGRFVLAVRHGDGWKAK
jgi:hypothetical protein